jgi:AAA domain
MAMNTSLARRNMGFAWPPGGARLHRRTARSTATSGDRKQQCGNGFSFFRFRRACIRLSPPLLGFVSATFCEAIELRLNVSALVELDWLSGIVADANQLAAQDLNRLKLYIALERAKLVERRAIAFRVNYHVSGLPFAIVSGVHDFREERTAEDMVKIAQEVEQDTGEPVVLIVIDTLSRALCGGDENGPVDMGSIVNSIEMIKQATGAHVALVHHIPVDGSERLRGHGSLLGALDTTLHIARTGDIRSATVVKANDSDEGERVAFTLASVTIGTNTTAPIVVAAEGNAALPKASSRKLSDRQKLALSALTECLLNCGEPTPSSFKLSSGLKAAPVDKWREEMLRRGVIPADSKNPRTAFDQVRHSLAARGEIGERDGLVWKARV